MDNDSYTISNTYGVSVMVVPFLQKIRMVRPEATRSIIKDTMFKITIPQEWAEYFRLQKGQKVHLVLTTDGFTVNFGVPS